MEHEETQAKTQSTLGVIDEQLLTLLSTSEDATASELRVALQRALRDSEHSEALHEAIQRQRGVDPNDSQAFLLLIKERLEAMATQELIMTRNRRWWVSSQGHTMLKTTAAAKVDLSSDSTPVDPPQVTSVQLTSHVAPAFIDEPFVHQLSTPELSTEELINAQRSSDEVSELSEVRASANADHMNADLNSSLSDMNHIQESPEHESAPLIEAPPLKVISAREGSEGMKAIISAGGAERCSFEEPSDSKQQLFKVLDLTLNRSLTFTECHFDYLQLIGGGYEDITFIDCTFKGPLTIETCELKGALRFEGCTLDDITLCGKSQVVTKRGEEALLACFLSFPQLSFERSHVKGELSLKSVLLNTLTVVESELGVMSADRLNHLGTDDAWLALSTPPHVLRDTRFHCQKSVLHQVNFSRVQFAHMHLDHAQLTGGKPSKKKTWMLIRELRANASQLIELTLSSATPAFKMIAEGSLLSGFTLDISGGDDERGALYHLDGDDVPRRELSLQDNLLCGVTFKLGNRINSLYSTRDILSGESRARGLHVEGGEVVDLKVSALMIDDGHLSLKGIQAEVSSLDLHLARLKPHWRGAQFIDELDQLRALDNSNEDSNEDSHKEQTSEGSHLTDITLRLMSEFQDDKNKNVLWGLKLDQCSLKRVKKLMIPVRQVRFYKSDLTGDAAANESVLVELPSDEFTVKGCTLDRFELISSKHPRCDVIKVERTRLHQCSLRGLTSSFIRFSSCELFRLYLDDLVFTKQEKKKGQEQNLCGLSLFMCKSVTTHDDDTSLLIRGLSIPEGGVLSLDRSTLQDAVIAHVQTPRLDLKSAKLIDVQFSHVSTQDIRLWRIPKHEILISTYLLNRNGQLFVKIESPHLNDISAHLNRAGSYTFESSETHRIAGKGLSGQYITDRDVFLLEPKNTLPVQLLEQGDNGSSDQETTADQLRDQYAVIQVDDKLLEGLELTDGELLPPSLIQSLLYQVRDLYESTLIKRCEFNHCKFIMPEVLTPPYEELYHRIERLEESNLQKIIKRPRLEGSFFKACELSGPVFKGLDLNESCNFSQGTQLSGEVLAHTLVSDPFLVDDCVISSRGTFKQSHFSDRVSLRDCLIRVGATETFDRAEFFDEVHLNHLVIEERLSLREASFRRDLTLNRLMIQSESLELLESTSQEAPSILIDLEGSSFEGSLSLKLPRVKGGRRSGGDSSDHQPPTLKVNLAQIEVKEKLDLSELYQTSWESQQRVESMRSPHPLYDQRVQVCLLLTHAAHVMTPPMSHELRAEITEQVKPNVSPTGQPLAFYSSKLEGGEIQDQRRHQAKLALEHYEWLTLFERSARERNAPHEVGYYMNQQRRLLTEAHGHLFRLPTSRLVRLMHWYQLDIYKMSGGKSVGKFLIKLLLIATVFFALHRFIFACKLSLNELLTLVTFEAWLSPVLSLLDIDLESLESMKTLNRSNQALHALQRILSLLLLAPLVGSGHLLVTPGTIAQQIRHALRRHERHETSKK